MSGHGIGRSWQSDLVSRYPDLFNVAQHGGTYTPGYPECGQGWRDLLERACARIRAALTADGDTFSALQIKEKYGTLRFYWTGRLSNEAEARAEEAIDLAEARSACTCELCGEKGRLHRKGGWLMTRCEAHAEGQAVEIEPGSENVQTIERMVGKRREVLCRRYDRAADSFVAINPAEDETGVSSGVPAPIELLEHDRWDIALAWLRRQTGPRVGQFGIEAPNTISHDRKNSAIHGFVHLLFAQARPFAGDLALAWQMLLCDPKRPSTFTVLPQIQWLLDNRVVVDPDQLNNLRERLRIWWRAAEGEWTDSEVSIFRIVDIEIANRAIDDDPDAGKPVEQPPPAEPTVVVMPHALAEERNMPLAWREMRDQAVPLVVCREVAAVRDALRAEFPHSWNAISLLLNELRDGRPVRMRPTLLVGPPGSGKSRLVRRLGELLGLFVYRYDGAAAHDGTYAGSPKSWSSAQPSVPARAIMMSHVANPIALVDEIEKGGTGSYNGNLWNSMTPFLERETAARYRETALDAQLDLSHVSHLATANSIDTLPGPLRDRYRTVKIEAPTLMHLPQLAANVMAELASEDEARRHDEPLTVDELENIGRAWERRRFSMRWLQPIVRVTLEVRDQCAPRH